MRRMKSTTRRQQMVAASSSSSKEDLSLGAADHDEASAPTCDAASSSAVSQRRDNVPS
jgi:hypothetical protein